MNGSHPTPAEGTSDGSIDGGRERRPSPYPWIAIAGAAAVLSGVAILLRTAALAEAWLLIFVLLAGFGAASLGLVMIGQLLGDVWLDPVRDELEPASWTVPLMAILALPVAASLWLLYPWAGQAPPALPALRDWWLTPGLFLVRGAVYLAAWTWLAAAVTRVGPHRGLSAAGLALLAATFSLASIDWVLSREPQWWSSLAPFAFAVNQLLAALAAAILVTVARQGHVEREPLESLERTLLTLALLALWVWFSQYLVIWMGNLPEEASWLLARMGTGTTMVIVLASVVGTLIAAIVLLIPSRARRWRVLIACVLILLHHVAYTIWLLRPSRIDRLSAGELVLIIGMLAVWGAWFALGLARYSALRRSSGPRSAEGEGRG